MGRDEDSSHHRRCVVEKRGVLVPVAKSEREETRLSIRGGEFFILMTFEKNEGNTTVAWWKERLFFFFLPSAIIFLQGFTYSLDGSEGRSIVKKIFDATI